MNADGSGLAKVSAGQSTSQITTVNNTSTSAISVSNIVPGDPQYAVSSRSFGLAAAGSRDITVSYTPLAGRSPASTLTILTSDLEVPSLTVVLMADVGVSAGPSAIGVLPTSLNFGSVALGQTKSGTLSVRNGGGSALQVLDIVSSSADVAVSKTMFTLAPGQEERLTVTLQPGQVELVEYDLTGSTVRRRFQAGREGPCTRCCGMRGTRQVGCGPGCTWRVCGAAGPRSSSN